MENDRILHTEDKIFISYIYIHGKNTKTEVLMELLNQPAVLPVNPREHQSTPNPVISSMAATKALADYPNNLVDAKRYRRRDLYYSMIWGKGPVRSHTRT